RLVDPLDELVLGIRLPELERVVASGLATGGFDLRQRRAAVDVRLAGAQSVQGGAVENVEEPGGVGPGHGVVPMVPISLNCRWLSPGSRAPAAGRARGPART